MIFPHSTLVCLVVRLDETLSAAGDDGGSSLSTVLLQNMQRLKAMHAACQLRAILVLNSGDGTSLHQQKKPDAEITAEAVFAVQMQACGQEYEIIR